MSGKNRQKWPSSARLTPETLSTLPAHSSTEAFLGEDEDGDETTYDEEDSSMEFEPRSRRRHAGRATDLVQKINTSRQPGYLILHRVHCTGKEFHTVHKPGRVYSDPPRLFNGDSKASSLRGKKEIAKVKDYIGQYPLVSFVVYKEYDCNEYHKNHEVSFTPLSIPADPKLPKSVEPFFFKLWQHGNTAIPASEVMTIMSDELMNAVSSITGMNQRRLTSLDRPENMDMLQHRLYYYRRLRDKDTVDLSSTQRQLMDGLLEYVKMSYGPQYDEADEMFSRGMVNQKHIAKLFSPNDIIVSTENGQSVAFAIKEPPQSGQLPLVLRYWSWKLNVSFYREEKESKLSWPASGPPDEEIPISSLSMYPLRHAPPGLEKQLRSRGEVLWKCRKRHFVAYNPPNTAIEVQNTNPRYMIDMNTYMQMHGNSENTIERDDLGHEAMDKAEPPEDPFLLLLPAEILGFGFNDKKWRTLLVSRVTEITWNEKAFDYLYLKHRNKELIKALVTVHTHSTKRSTDIIEGKGNALIILLHGGPGTGKTLTAESVAELTRKPLYRVTCGDIGTNADEVEKYLESIFLINTIWGCVVLLDEADVFLEERRETDLQRNALVSVFLRALEYYDGILVLTSNRIGTFDAAFKSRFQLTIYYPPLDRKGRYEIWLNFINGLSKTNPDVDIDQLKEKIETLAGAELNGRQIRNTVTTALQLAYFRKEAPGYSHFETVINVVDEFEGYLAGTQGHGDADWARHQGIRME
ncbi:hypothetical protein FQN55_005749 [Onygenales sp. PD_40]|nr:hypothetical protein FQN55_005749 [Onygenales sp. PD_40]KAK2781121.1 hypothetical protein FQN53_000812 [Emmonsiellopsis sp. PD_33]KAK2802457.1 hypothetical protein FQN51_004520 [Onygenales sp. PD_10]